VTRYFLRLPKVTTTDLTLTELVVLAALSDRPRYGYEVVQRVEELTSSRIQLRPGNLYRVLHRLVAHDLVTEVPAPRDVDERRRYFRVTALGRRAAASQLTMLSGLLQRVPALRDALAHG
jgi:DNA-binding PadR family transcriptional regulator